MINYNENETENKKYINRSNINRTRSRHGHKCTNYKMCHSTIMVMCIKQDLTTSEAEFMKKLSNIEAEFKKALLIKNSVYRPKCSQPIRLQDF